MEQRASRTQMIPPGVQTFYSTVVTVLRHSPGAPRRALHRPIAQSTTMRLNATQDSHHGLLARWSYLVPI